MAKPSSSPRLPMAVHDGLTASMVEEEAGDTDVRRSDDFLTLSSPWQVPRDVLKEAG